MPFIISSSVGKVIGEGNIPQGHLGRVTVQDTSTVRYCFISADGGINCVQDSRNVINAPTEIENTAAPISKRGASIRPVGSITADGTVDQVEGSGIVNGTAVITSHIVGHRTVLQRDRTRVKSPTAGFVTMTDIDRATIFSSCIAYQAAVDQGCCCKS